MKTRYKKPLFSHKTNYTLAIFTNHHIKINKSVLIWNIIPRDLHHEHFLLSNFLFPKYLGMLNEFAQKTFLFLLDKNTKIIVDARIPFQP
ncbi:MAG: hypothetical protein DWQ02_12875 [Bacteroidetes bacterium]|nr:MAG: hypothetical protein DWQ02_12875 [Bacteroidota bacterium]